MILFFSFFFERGKKSNEKAIGAFGDRLIKA